MCISFTAYLERKQKMKEMVEINFKKMGGTLRK